VFCVDEIIVFNDGQSKTPSGRNGHHQGRGRDFEGEDGYTGVSDPDHFLYHLLTYLECPPYLRQKLFPIHPNLRTAGSSHSLDMPHHLKSEEWCHYREGVTVETGDANAETSLVDVGFTNPITVDAPIPPYTRVTLKFDSIDTPASFPFRPNAPPSAIPSAEAVDPAEPRETAGYYWGYTVRQASSLSNVFTESPFEDGYDVSIGTSERGVALSELLYKQTSKSKSSTRSLPDSFKHALIVFGGVAGLEAAAGADSQLAETGIKKENVGELFDFWVNACPGQGSRTIRTEEAIWVTLSQLHGWNQAANQ
jgi:predicted SPOUT superfamily RNA methylase MTH1